MQRKIHFRLKHYQTLLIMIGIVFILIGIYRNEVNTVYAKAIKLCLECVGIG